MNNIGFLADGFRELDPEAASFSPDTCIEADCGHEVFSGEYIFFWDDDPISLCPDCFSDRFDALSLVEKAELLGSDCHLV